MKSKSLFITLAVISAAVVLTAIGVAVFKSFARPVKSKYLGESIGTAGLRYVYGDYIYNPKTGKKLITDIDWLYCTSGDSIAILAKDGKRAYLNLNTAEQLTPLDYDKAWIFACNRGVMVRRDSVFIFRRDGSIVNKEGFPYHREYEMLFFHDRLILHGTPDLVGVIDTAAQWILQPEYKSISMDYSHNLYTAEQKDLWQVLDFNLTTILSGNYRSIDIDWSEGIIATEYNGIEHLFSYEGKMLYEVIYSRIRELRYQTEKLDKDGDPVYAPTNCYAYESYSGKWGLMNRQYKVLTPPQFCSIEAQTQHLFFASFGQYHSRFGTLIDELGRPVR